MSAFIFPEQWSSLHPLRAVMNQAYRRDEAECVNTLIQATTLSDAMWQEIQKNAKTLVEQVRAERVGKGGLDAFLMQYDLSTEEGIALMCLAEATLRVPDSETVNRLIQDKITAADWQAHCGKSDSYFVNAASWALMLTGKILNPQQTNGHYFIPVLRRLGEPVIRQAVAQAMRILGKQFVMGRTIVEALQRSKKDAKQGYRFSYDMLGEAARTQVDAERYYHAYEEAIAAIAKSEQGKDVYQSAGISIKLSALYPRYEFAQQAVCLPVLTQRLKQLALQAKAANINLTVDAEEADRLDLSLDLIAAVLSDDEFRGWNGFGLAVQAYQKRAFYLIDWLADLAKRCQCKLMVRLVKGAYWDYEIKDSQVKGLEGYPVFTRKMNTDVSYLACAKKLLDYGDLFYPQFATHNAYTVAAILTLVGERRDFEFQCLKGMGHALYDQITPKDKRAIPCRVYAPVGQHEDLLPYLVRRLLENGANTSFVNRIVDEKTPIDQLIQHPTLETQKMGGKGHSKIPLPMDIYGVARQNSRGIDLSDRDHLEKLSQQMEQALQKKWQALPTFQVSDSSHEKEKNHSIKTVSDPSSRDRIIGTVIQASQEDLELALQQATAAQSGWDALGVETRATYLLRLADLLQDSQAELMAILVREAGKTIPDALGEVREAIDFCRYYAMLGRQMLAPVQLPGPTGEENILYTHGRGVILCVSPWNFPLAIFTGQVVAGLVAGNCVLAKPAEQTPLIAARAIDLMHQAGIPKAVVQLLPGKGSVIGAAAVADLRIHGIMFTGSTETARGINQTLANREGEMIPFIAETGGQNVLIADSTALPEQLVVDVMASAFNSAGQRCSALRVLYIQAEIADKFITMLQGAMAEIQLGEPGWLATDVGPVIDEKSRATLEAHAQRMSEVGKLIYQIAMPSHLEQGSFFAPRAYEIPSLDLLKREVFGPILHVIRYQSHELDSVIQSINSTGYGLTFGIHSRIKSKVRFIQERIQAGNIYVNRNMIGAVVGVQPFGGEKLSGTGPKAGGPHYLTRLIHERTVSENTTAAGGNASLMTLDET